MRSFTLTGCLSALLLSACASGPSMLSPSAAPNAATRSLPSQVPPQVEEELLKIGRTVAPPPTAALYAPLQPRDLYAGIKVARDMRYGPDVRNYLDVFTPTTTGASRPVLVFVHGGAFMRGERLTPGTPFNDNIMAWAVNNGMVGVNITYRLAPANPWPAAQQDVAAALNWVRQNIAPLGGDPNRIVLMGHSAGAAHVAQYVGHSRFHVAPGGGIAAAVMLSGLFDITKAEVNPPLQSYFGTDPALYAQRSALPGMLASKLPMMLSYAELDPADFQSQAEQARAALCDAGRCPPTYKLLGHSHMSEIDAINSPDRALTDALKAFIATATSVAL